jgi:hypothetical protein
MKIENKENMVRKFAIRPHYCDNCWSIFWLERFYARTMILGMTYWRLCKECGEKESNKEREEKKL